LQFLPNRLAFVYSSNRFEKDFKRLRKNGLISGLQPYLNATKF